MKPVQKHHLAKSFDRHNPIRSIVVSFRRRTTGSQASQSRIFVSALQYWAGSVSELGGRLEHHSCWNGTPWNLSTGPLVQQEADTEQAARHDMPPSSGWGNVAGTPQGFQGTPLVHRHHVDAYLLIFPRIVSIFVH